MAKPPRLGRRSILALLAVTLLALGGSAAALSVIGGKAKAPLAMPALFADRDLPLIDRLAAAPVARADVQAKRYLAAHPARNDAAFESFALATVGPPPGPAVQRAELAELHRLGDHRTPQGVAASVWLEKNGKKAVWKTYVKQFAQLYPKAPAKQQKALYADTYAIAVALTTAGKNRFVRPSPYLTDPSLHAVNQAKFSAQTKYSYPSKHAVIGFAETPLLARLEPHRATEFVWMRDELAYSRLYAGGHYPSDVAAGIYLGELLADYERAVGPPTSGA